MSLHECVKIDITSTNEACQYHHACSLTFLAKKNNNNKKKTKINKSQNCEPEPKIRCRKSGHWKRDWLIVAQLKHSLILHFLIIIISTHPDFLAFNPLILLACHFLPFTHSLVIDQTASLSKCGISLCSNLLRLTEMAKCQK